VAAGAGHDCRKARPTGRAVLTRRERQERALERRARDAAYWRELAARYDYLDKEDKMMYCMRKARIAEKDVENLNAKLGGLISEVR
jgi:hypothetical protein